MARTKYKFWGADVVWTALLVLFCVIAPVVLLVVLAERFGYVRTGCVTLSVITLLLIVGVLFFILIGGGMYAVGP